MGIMTLPHATAVNTSENLVFVTGGADAVPCSTCSGSRLEPPLVRSSWRRVDVYVATSPRSAESDLDDVAVPICWRCVREKTRGACASSHAWRSAVAGFLNALNEADPRTFKCGLRGLD